MKDHERLRKHPLLWSAVGVMHTFLCAGIVFGWASLLPILQKQQQQQRDGVQQLTATGYATVFSCGAIGNYLCNLPFGLVLDRYGPKTCGIVASLFFAVGLLLCSRSATSSTLLMIGFGLLGFVGPAIQLPTLHLAKLWKGGGAALMGAQAAAFDGGTAIFALAALAYQKFGVTPSTFFLSYLVVPLFTLLTAIFIWPTTPLGDDDDDGTNNSNVRDNQDEDGSFFPIIQRASSTSLAGPGSPFLSQPPTNQKRQRHHHHHGGVISPDQTGPTTGGVLLKDAPLKTILSHPPFWCLTIWVSTHILKLNFVVATINHQLENVFDMSSTKDDLINIFGAMLPFGFVILPPAAYFLEHSPISAFQLANAFGLLYASILCFFPSHEWLQVGMVFPVVATSRQLVYSGVFHELGVLFGFTNYGVLLGLVNICVSVFSLTQSAFVLWAERSGTYFGPNLVLLIVTLPLFFIVYRAVPLSPSTVSSSRRTGFKLGGRRKMTQDYGAVVETQDGTLKMRTSSLGNWVPETPNQESISQQMMLLADGDLIPPSSSSRVPDAAITF